MPDDSKQLIPKVKKLSPRRLKKVELAYVHKQLLVVLQRETEALLDRSYKTKLSKEDAVQLPGYIRLVKDLIKQEEEQLEDLTDEELEKLANK